MKIALLLSGGVDSSVALSLLKEEGHDVTAFYLKIWLEDELAFLGDCPWEEDLSFCRKVCEQFDVPLEIINLQQEYWQRVVKEAISELKEGRTPSPDILCNQQIKFGEFFKHLSDEFDKVASGHYAQVEEIDGIYYLKQSPDRVKDQTYFLTYLSQEQLSKIIFPIGKYTKEEIREIANRYNLANAARKDSQGICFLGKIKYNDFVKFNLGERPGDIIDIATGKVLGRHKGFWFHTIGQRQGLGLGGGPWYVAKKDIDNNIIYVNHAEAEFKPKNDEFLVRNMNWISRLPNSDDLQVKLRHGPFKNDCKIKLLDNGKYFVNLAKEDQGISPGQYAIFYEGEYCLGGGIIELSEG